MKFFPPVGIACPRLHVHFRHDALTVTLPIGAMNACAASPQTPIRHWRMTVAEGPIVRHEIAAARCR